VQSTHGRRGCAVTWNGTIPAPLHCEEDQTNDHAVTAGSTNVMRTPTRSFRRGQSLVEFALVLPLLVMVVFGVLELGRVFFAYIAITNASREGARVYTFRPNVTLIADITTAALNEVGSVPLVDKTRIVLPLVIQCGNSYSNVTTDTQLLACPKFEPIRVTVTYNHSLIFRFIFPQTVTLRRSAEMMVP
jgi:Flp pilus assembly protein TadG